MSKKNIRTFSFSGEVDLDSVVSTIKSKYPSLEVKEWSKKGKTGKRKSAKAGSEQESSVGA